MLDYIVGQYNMDRLMSNEEKHLTQTYIDKILKKYNKNNQNISYLKMYS